MLIQLNSLVLGWVVTWDKINCHVVIERVTDFYSLTVRAVNNYMSRWEEQRRLCLLTMGCTSTGTARVSLFEKVKLL